MSIENTIILGISLILVCLLFVSLFEYILPMYSKLQFSSVCRTYYLLAEEQNGLAREDVDRLKQKLIELGIDQIKVTCSDKLSVKKGSLNILSVTGVYRYSSIKNLTRRQQSEVIFKFEEEFLSRKISM